MEVLEMKKVITIALVCLLCFSLVGCAKTYIGTDELIEKARKEIPISDADTIDMQYAGMCIIDDKALAWFISGNEYQSHYYLPMEVEVKGGDEYAFVRSYMPMDGRGEDIAILNWNEGYAFVINNPKCAKVKITGDKGIHEENVDKGAYPYVFYYPSILSEYVFLDAEGNEQQ